MKVCAVNPLMGEYSLCGDAFDAPDDPECDTPTFILATRPGQIVTCEGCLKCIQELRARYTDKGRVRNV